MSRPPLRPALLVVAGLMSGAGCIAMSSGPDEQDACQIGQVSPAEYRAIAAEIVAMPPVDWDEAHGAGYTPEGVAAALRERLQQVLADRTSEDEQTAAMHAQMRSIGAELSYSSGGSDAKAASYRYRLDVNRIGMTRVLSRWAQIVILFEKPPDHGDYPALERVVALMPEMLDPGWPGWKKPPQEEACPPPPSVAPNFQERLDRYNQRH